MLEKCGGTKKKRKKILWAKKTGTFQTLLYFRSWWIAFLTAEQPFGFCHAVPLDILPQFILFFFFPLLKVMMTICSYRSILCMTQNSPYTGTYCTSTVESLYYIFVPCQLCYQCKINGFWHTAAQHVNSGSNTAVKGFVYWYTRIWWQR